MAMRAPTIIPAPTVDAEMPRFSNRVSVGADTMLGLRLTILLAHTQGEGRPLEGINPGHALPDDQRVDVMGALVGFHGL